VIPDGLAEIAEPESSGSEQRNQLFGGGHCLPAVRARVLVIAVVHDDDVAVGGARSQPAGELFGL